MLTLGGTRRSVLLRLLMLLTGLQVVFATSVLLSMQVPDRLILGALREASAAGAVSPTEYRGTPLGTRSDRFTECLVFTTGLGDTGDDGLLGEALAAGNLGSCAQAIPPIARGETPTAAKSYERFWHGYTLVTRPALATVGVDGMRVISGWLVLASLAFFVRMFPGHRVAGLALVAVFVGTTDLLFLPDSTSHALGMALCFTGAGLVGWAFRAGRSDLLPAAALVSGSLYAFGDLLATPAVSAVLATFTGAAGAWVAAGPRRSVVRAVAVAGAAWIAGWALTWGTKWLLDLALYGIDRVRRNVIDQILFRRSGDYPGVQDSFGAGVTAPVRYWFEVDPLRHLALVAMLILLLLLLAVVLRRGVTSLLDVGSLGLPVLGVLLWLEFASNHSQIHTFFSFRNVAACVAVLVAAAVLVLRADPRSGRWGSAGPRTETASRRL